MSFEEIRDIQYIYNLAYSQAKLLQHLGDIPHIIIVSMTYSHKLYRDSHLRSVFRMKGKEFFPLTLSLCHKVVDISLMI